MNVSVNWDYFENQEKDLVKMFGATLTGPF